MAARTDQIQNKVSTGSLKLEYIKDQRLKNSADVSEKHGSCDETAKTLFPWIILKCVLTILLKVKLIISVPIILILN